jgi:hypothetical protein
MSEMRITYVHVTYFEVYVLISFLSFHVAFNLTEIAPTTIFDWKRC